MVRHLDMVTLKVIMIVVYYRKLSKTSFVYLLLYMDAMLLVAKRMLKPTNWRLGWWSVWNDQIGWCKENIGNGDSHI
jgi:hypothetical protein